jgi:MEMO1 family protein
LDRCFLPPSTRVSYKYDKFSAITIAMALTCECQDLGGDRLASEDGIFGGCIVPHPPLLIPDIGGKDREKVSSTSKSMEILGERISELGLDVLVMISPHTPMHIDTFTIKNIATLQGSFAAFGCPRVRIAKQNDMDLVEAMLLAARKENFPLEGIAHTSSRWSSPGEELDHGLLVPLYFLDKHIETPIISLSISGLGYRSHFQLGKMAHKACSSLGRKALFVASGDLSHRLIPGAPAGYSPRGENFDQLLVDIAASGNFDSLYDIDEGLVEEAGECGLRSIHTMWGALKNGVLSSSVLSYEGPFGVGYLVSLQVKGS